MARPYVLDRERGLVYYSEKEKADAGAINNAYLALHNTNVVKKAAANELLNRHLSEGTLSVKPAIKNEDGSFSLPRMWNEKSYKDMRNFYLKDVVDSLAIEHPDISKEHLKMITRNTSDITTINTKLKRASEDINTISKKITITPDIMDYILKNQRVFSYEKEKPEFEDKPISYDKTSKHEYDLVDAATFGADSTNMWKKNKDNYKDTHTAALNKYNTLTSTGGTWCTMSGACFGEKNILLRHKNYKEMTESNNTEQLDKSHMIITLNTKDMSINSNWYTGMDYKANHIPSVVHLANHGGDKETDKYKSGIQEGWGYRGDNDLNYEDVSKLVSSIDPKTVPSEHKELFKQLTTKATYKKLLPTKSKIIAVDKVANLDNAWKNKDVAGTDLSPLSMNTDFELERKPSEFVEFNPLKK